MKWYLKAIKNYAGFTGRARRKEFWLFCFFSYMILVLYGFFKAILHLPEYEIETFLGMVYLLAILCRAWLSRSADCMIRVKAAAGSASV